MPKLQRPKTLHYVLGTIALLAVIALALLDTLPGYTASFEIIAVLAVSYIILLGHAAIVAYYIEAKYK